MSEKNKTKKLNKGLDAIFGGDISELLNDIESNTPSSNYVEVALKDIRPNPYQPRRYFDEEKLAELAQSIKEHGLLQPVVLKPSTISGYEIISGERRVRASRKAGLENIQAILVDFTEQQMLEMALIENIQREDLNAIEEARAYKAIMETLSLTQEEAAQRLGKSRAHIANTLRLLNLCDEIQDMVLKGELSMGQVRPLVTLPQTKALELAKRAVAEKLSARELENMARLYMLNATKTHQKPEKNKEYSYVETLLRRKLKTRIKVEDKKITIKYTDTHDLNRILGILGVIEEGE